MFFLIFANRSVMLLPIAPHSFTREAKPLLDEDQTFTPTRGDTVVLGIVSTYGHLVD